MEMAVAENKASLIVLLKAEITACTLSLIHIFNALYAYGKLTAFCKMDDRAYKLSVKFVLVIHKQLCRKIHKVDV